MDTKPGAGRRGPVPPAVGLLLCVALLDALLYLGLCHVRPMRCPHGHFHRGPAGGCAPWLTCEELRAQVRPLRCAGQGAVKTVSLALMGRGQPGAASRHLHSRPLLVGNHCSERPGRGGA